MEAEAQAAPLRSSRLTRGAEPIPAPGAGSAHCLNSSVPIILTSVSQLARIRPTVQRNLVSILALSWATGALLQVNQTAIDLLEHVAGGELGGF